MNKSFAIFDMDGTLVDSMRFWKTLGLEYLGSRGIENVPREIMERIKPMTMTESASLFIETFALPGTPEQAAAQMNAMMERHYREDIPAKEGVAAYLEKMKKRGVRMCVASATAAELQKACLKRLGILEYFEFIISCEEVGAGKSRPDVYLKAAERLGAEPEDTAVYEDAFYAVRTAKNAGFYVVGVYDESARECWEEIRTLSDETLRDWQGTERKGDGRDSRKQIESEKEQGEFI